MKQLPLIHKQDLQDFLVQEHFRFQKLFFLHLWKNLDLGINYRFQKRNGRYAAGYDETTKTNILKKYSPYSILDARLSWNKPTYSLYIEGNNLISHRYVDFGNLKQPGFWFIAGAKINITL